MKLLISAAIRNSKHLLLAILTLLTLLILPIANQMEMFALGIMANSGVDFFALFGKEKGQGTGKVLLEDVQKNWYKIDTTHSGVIKKNDASYYIAHRKDRNLLQRLFGKIAPMFDVEKNFASLILVLVFVAFFKAAFLFLSRYASSVLSIRVTRDLRFQFFEHIQSLPLSFYQEYNLGNLTSRAVGDAGQIAVSLQSCMTNYIQTPFTLLSTLGMCFYLSWKLSLVIFIGLPLVVMPMVILTKRVKRVTRQMQRNQETFTSVLLDFLAGIHTVKIFTMEGFSLKKYKEQNDRMADLEVKNAKYSLLTRPVLHMITTICLSIVVLFGLYTLHISISELIVFCGLLYVFYEPVKKFAEENSSVQRGIVAAERMFEVLVLKPNITDHKGVSEIKNFLYQIEFDRVSFKYKDEWVLKDLSFTVEKGQTVAIVGPTGAGKSTIVQLLPRLYDVQEGEIRIDGVPISDYSLKSLRQIISFVPQKPFLFFDTVTSNITIGQNYTEEEVVEAAQKAHAHEFIVDLPGQYQSLLAEAGKSLSGGQQQRLAIARALIKKGAILVLDEATSSLDPISENYIKSAIKELQGSVTQIIIAHRLSTIEHADKIIYLEKGRKIGEGTKEELLRTCPRFKGMWEAFHRTDLFVEV